jgi:hypothetical protein
MSRQLALASMFAIAASAACALMAPGIAGAMAQWAPILLH